MSTLGAAHSESGEPLLWKGAETAFQWETPLPQFRRIHQQFDRPLVEDIPATIGAIMEAQGGAAKLGNGKRVAITAGSRGIARMPEILAAVVAQVKSYGGSPFIVPSMGSHGRATAEGQKQLLADLGITPETVGAPIEATMEVVELGRLDNGMSVWMDKYAAAADAIIPVNRVKPHTDFRGTWESGLAKITGIGLGKRMGADTIHRYGTHGLRDLLPMAARLAVKQRPIVFGIAIIENAYDELGYLRGVAPEQIAGPEEAELLVLARASMPFLPFDEIDVLLIDEMGKNVSGAGMDPNVHGHMRVYGFGDTHKPGARIIAVMSLTPQSHGNATGIGFADITTRQLVEEIDFEAMYINGITAGLGGVQRIGLPVVTPHGRAAVMTALRVCGQAVQKDARVVRVQNTLKLGDMDVSEGLWPEVERMERLSFTSEPFDLRFDEEQKLVPFKNAL